MSVTEPPTRDAVAAPPGRPRAGSRRAWLRLGLVAALLVGSGGLRAWQDHRVRRTLSAGRAWVVPLERVPTELGPWSGADAAIDPQIVRGTGADRVVTRRYTNRNTGVSVDVILLFGPAGDMSVHTPPLCYAMAGYRPLEGPAVREVPVAAPGGESRVGFQTAVYAKGEGGRVDRQEVYWTWRYEGAWSPEVARAKYIERVPSLVKVQTARPVLAGERRGPQAPDEAGPLNPNEALLRLLMPEVERLLTPTPSRTT